jgi:hypothetical protein
MEEPQVERRVRLAAYGYFLAQIAAAAAFGYLFGGSGVAVAAAAMAALVSVTIAVVMHRMGRL